MKRLTLRNVLVGAVAAALVCGCASMGKGPSDEELVMDVINAWAATLPEQDMEKAMTYYSEDFEHYEYGDKEGLEDFLEDAAAMGYLDDAETNLDEVEIEIEENTATVYPIELTAAFGSGTIELTLTKEASGKWMITGMEVEAY